MTQKITESQLNPIELSRKDLNPYRMGLSLILRSALWDMQPISWRSRWRVRKYKDVATGKKAVILCNGPSLNDTNFDVLSDIPIFGLNKINLLFNKTKMRPNYIVAVNKYVIEQNAAFFEETSIPLFLDYKSASSLKRRSNHNFLYTNVKGFARDPMWGVATSNTVTYVAMQLAFYMGYTDVALVGCDHNFATVGPANKTVTSAGPDLSHFDPTYFAPGMDWQLPDLFKSEVGYTEARRVYEAFGRRIVNCTTGGALEIFPRMELSEWVNSPPIL